MSENIYKRVMQCFQHALGDFFAGLIQRAVRGRQHNVIARQQIIGQVERAVGANFHFDAFQAREKRRRIRD